LVISNNALVALTANYGDSSGGFVVDGTITSANNVTFKAPEPSAPTSSS